MPKKQRASDKQTRITIGDITNISGNINVAGGSITTHHTVNGLNTIEIKQLFDELYKHVDSQKALSVTDQEDIKTEIQDIQTTVTDAIEKNTKVDESFLSRRFRNIARMAPDVLDVIVTTLVNPLAGLGVAAKKIAEKAKKDLGPE